MKVTIDMDFVRRELQQARDNLIAYQREEMLRDQREQERELTRLVEQRRAQQQLELPFNHADSQSEEEDEDLPHYIPETRDPLDPSNLDGGKKIKKMGKRKGKSPKSLRRILKKSPKKTSPKRK